MVAANLAFVVASKLATVLASKLVIVVANKPVPVFKVPDVFHASRSRPKFKEKRQSKFV